MSFLNDYERLTLEQSRCSQRVIELHIARARLLEQWHKAGVPYAAIATIVGLTRGRVYQMVGTIQEETWPDVS